MGTGLIIMLIVLGIILILVESFSYRDLPLQAYLVLDPWCLPVISDLRIWDPERV